MKLQSIALLVLIVLALFAPVSVWAQEPTEEPAVIEVEAGESTEIDTPQDTTEIVVTSEEPEVITVEQEIPDYYMLAVVFASALFSVLAGGGTMAVILARANRDVPAKDSTEKLLASLVSEDMVREANAVTNRVLDILESIGKPALTFIRDVTDGQPNTGAQG